MGKVCCQLCIAFLIIVGLFTSIHNDIEGKPATKPTGYDGVYWTLIAVALVAGIQYFAGTFSQILP